MSELNKFPYFRFDEGKTKEEEDVFRPASRSISKLEFSFELIETFVFFSMPEKGGVEQHSWFFIRLFNNFSIRR